MKPLSVVNLSRLRDLLALLAAIRQLRQPLTSPEGLRQALELLSRLAELLGIEPGWIEQLRAILANEHVFGIVLAIVQYLASLIGDDDEPSILDAVDFEIDGQNFSDWLPFVLELLILWRRLRGA